MPTQQRGTGFIGLDRYLEANRGAAQRMADNLLSPVAERGAGAQQGLEDAWKEFEEKKKGGTLTYDPANLTAAQAAERAGKTYDGPNSLSDVAGYGYAREQADKAAKDSRLLADGAGRQALLQDAYGKEGGYTPGMQRFDSFLTGAAGNGRFEELRSKYGSLSEKFGADNTAAQGQAKEAVAATDKARGQYETLAPTLRAQEAAAAAKKAEEEAEARRREAERRAAERAGRHLDRHNRNPKNDQYTDP